MVVPLHVIVAPAHGVIIMIKASRVVWLILECFKLCFTHRVIIAHAGPAVTGGDGQLGEQVQVTVSGHGRPTVLVQREMARPYVVALGGFVNQLR